MDMKWYERVWDFIYVDVVIGAWAWLKWMWRFQFYDLTKMVIALIVLITLVRLAIIVG